jgi:hypothetical protein
MTASHRGKFLVRLPLSPIGMIKEILHVPEHHNKGISTLPYAIKCRNNQQQYHYQLDFHMKDSSLYH